MTTNEKYEELLKANENQWKTVAALGRRLAGDDTLLFTLFYQHIQELTALCELMERLRCSDPAFEPYVIAWMQARMPDTRQMLPPPARPLKRRSLPARKGQRR